MRAVLTAAVLTGVGSAVLMTYDREEPTPVDCERATRDLIDPIVLIVCQSEYAHTGKPATGAKLANALRRSEEPAAASTLATSLLTTSARSDALQVLGRIAFRANDLAAAQDHLALARALHVIERRPREVAADLQTIAGVLERQDRIADSLRALDDCILEARAARDRAIEGYCHLTAARVLGDLGRLTSARQELANAEPQLVKSRDLASLEIERGAIEQQVELSPAHMSHEREAAIAFEHALAHATAAGSTVLRRQAELNLVYSLAELGRTHDAALHLETARQLDPRDLDTTSRALLEARIAYHDGHFVRAAEINERNYARLDDGDDRRLSVTAMQARIGLATGDLESAIKWARQGVASAEAMRARAPLELRPWVLSSRRQPYELLFTALARANRVDEALVVFDSWQGRTLLDELGRDNATGPAPLRDAALFTESLRRLLPTLTTAPMMTPSTHDAVIGALRDLELIAIVVADDELWRISAHHGKLALVDVGPLAMSHPALEELQVHPTRVAMANLLGPLLLGADAFRVTNETLFVVLDSAIANLPLAGLRAGGEPLIAMRALVRGSRISELGCVPSPGQLHHAVVIADPRGDLRAARREAEVTAARFGVRAAVGPAATASALLAVTHDDVLDVAVHADVELGAGSLEMFFGQRVSALELSNRRNGPPLVVLSACASAAADDGELGMSLSTAFLASGSSQVVATLRPVSDLGASEVTAAFYRDAGVVDPARALARVQAQLARTENVDWPNFTIFGHDICRKESP